MYFGPVLLWVGLQHGGLDNSGTHIQHVLLCHSCIGQGGIWIELGRLGWKDQNKFGCSHAILCSSPENWQLVERIAHLYFLLNTDHMLSKEDCPLTATTILAPISFAGLLIARIKESKWKVIKIITALVKFPYTESDHFPIYPATVCSDRQQLCRVATRGLSCDWCPIPF